jgi:hypothetical protein
MQKQNKQNKQNKPKNKKNQKPGLSKRKALVSTKQSSNSINKNKFIRILNKTPYVAKLSSHSGSDFIRKLDLYPKDQLTQDIKLMYTTDISPSAFPNTRMELTSNTYQMYRFKKLSFKFQSMLPTSINAQIIAYIDTDPSDTQNDVVTADDVLRLAKAHQGAVIKDVQSNWDVKLPIRNDDQFYFTGGKGELRTRSMGKLYIFQVGQATKFDGSLLTEILNAGSLSLDYDIAYQNPQLTAIPRIFDGISQKDIIRAFSNISWYRTFTVSADSTSQIGSSKYRQTNYVLTKELFVDGVGDYTIVKMPLSLTIPNTVKSINTFSMPKSNGNYKLPGTDLWTMLNNNIINVQSLENFINEAFKLVSGGIKVAKQIYDVISLVGLVLYNDNQVTGAQVNVNYTVGNSSVNEAMPLGQSVVSWDGFKIPFVQEIIEFKDSAHAADNAVTVNITSLLIAYKLDKTITGKAVEPTIPYLPKVT